MDTTEEKVYGMLSLKIREKFVDKIFRDHISFRVVT